MRSVLVTDRRIKARAAVRRWRSRNKERTAGYNKEYRAANKEKWRAYYRKRAAAKRAANKEKYNAYLRAWAKAHPDKILARNKKWAKRNSEKVRAAKARRRAPGTLTAAHIIEIRNLQRGRCAYCSIRLTRKIEQIDHITALANGGRNDRQNIQLLCSKCNQTKGKRDPIIFAQSIGRLV